MSGFNLSALAVRESAITIFLMVAISLLGAFAFLNLGRAENPSFTVKVMTVVTAWPGATASEMQNLVADPLEKRLQELQWYDRTETFTRPGLAFTTLTLRDDMPPSQLQDQFYQARKKLGDEAKNLPQGVIGPLVNDEYADVTFALYALKAPGLSHRDMVRKAEDLRQRLLHVSGVAKVNLIGEQPSRIFIDINHARLATLGVNAQAVFEALTARNMLTPAGSIVTQGPDVVVRIAGEPKDEADIASTPITVNGRTLRLGDIATVRRGYEDPATFLVRHEGKPALVLGVVMRANWNGLELGKALDDEIGSIQSDLPLGMTLAKVTDQSTNISFAIGEFAMKFVVALIVVMVISIFSLGGRAALIVAAAVPLTLATVFIIMMMTGREFDRITLGAIILALGLLVDDAIIAIESMVVRMEAGFDRISAAAYAWNHTAAPMLAGTLVTAVGLMPIGFAKSSSGEYAGNIFWIVAFALLASWVVAVSFTPYLGVKLLPQPKTTHDLAEAYNKPFYRRLRSLVGLAIRRKKTAVGIVVGLFIAAAGCMSLLTQQFFPSSDRPEVFVEIQLPYGSSIQRTNAVTKELESWLLKQPEAREVTTYIGQGAPRFILELSPELPDPAFAKIIVLTPDAHAREALIERSRRMIADGLGGGARVRATRLVFGPYSPYPVAFRVSGPDDAKVRRISEQVRSVMLKHPALRQVQEDWGQKTPAIRIDLDQNRLAALGLSNSAISQQLNVMLSGSAITELREDIRRSGVVVRADSEVRLEPARLGDLVVEGRNGERVPVSQLGTIKVVAEEPVLRRRDRTPTVTVSADIAEGLQPPDVSTSVQKDLAPIIAALPAGYKIVAGGPVEEAAKANDALAPLFPVMLLLMMTIIIIQVRSLSAMSMVLMTAPLGLVGVGPLLLLFDRPFGFTAILGVIGLAGILMRNTLILIGQIQDNEKAGLSAFEAVVEATVQRARPVVLTALAAILAFVPLTMSVFWGSMAFTLIGGTLAGTILTLVFLPALYAIWFRIKAPPGELDTIGHAAEAGQG